MRTFSTASAKHTRKYTPFTLKRTLIPSDCRKERQLPQLPQRAVKDHVAIEADAKRRLGEADVPDFAAFCALGEAARKEVRLQLFDVKAFS